MFARSVQLPSVGRLKRGWGKWQGRLPVAQLPEPLDLVIEVPHSEPVEPFAELAALFAATFGRLRDEFADELFESYQFYKKADLEAGGFTEADFAGHPAVRSRDDVWSALRPYRLCLFSPADRQMGNAYLLIDVDWPNPHFFQSFMKASAGYAAADWTDVTSPCSLAPSAKWRTVRKRVSTGEFSTRVFSIKTRVFWLADRLPHLRIGSDLTQNRIKIGSETARRSRVKVHRYANDGLEF